MVKLKPCPFCNGKPKRKQAKYNTLGTYGDNTTEKHWYGVYCTNCRVGQPVRFYFSREESDNAWNERS